MFTFGLCCPLGSPLFRSSRLFPFSFCFTRLFSIPLFICYSHFRWIRIFFAGIISCSNYLLLALLFVLLFHSADCEFPTLFYLDDFFVYLDLLLLGLMSAKSHPHVQLIRAELSSKSSSEPLSESLSKLSSHQIPRCLGSEGPLQLKVCTRSSTLFSPTTPSGASVLSAFFTHSALHFDLGVELGVFRRREGPPRKPLSGTPFFRL